MKLIPSTRSGALWRFALGALIVIAFTAVTTAVAGLLQFKQFAADLSLTPALGHAQVTIPNPGNPQTLLIIGSDHRAGASFATANTDTMMLVRLDPNSSTINVISIPRDLRVKIPVGRTVSVQKLNSAYSIGGPNLLIRVLKQQVFPGLQISHIIDVNFGGFEALVDAIGCVYTDVDHRYYNNTAQTDYSSIDIEPGYQKLCGVPALQFVRFRHTDSDLVRNARQQDFIRWAKDQYGPDQIVSNREQLLSIFGAHTQTDGNLHTTDGLINLFDLVAFSAGHSIKQVKFPAILLPCGGGGASPVRANRFTPQTPCYVSANPGAEARAFHQFMSPTAQPAVRAPGAGGSGRGRGGRAGPSPAPRTGGLIADNADGQQQLTALGRVGIPVYYPRMIMAGTNYCSELTANCNSYPNPAYEYANAYPRKYELHDQSDLPHVAYRMTLVINSLLGEYYGVQGTSWQHPPIISTPTQTVTMGGRRLMEFFNGHRLTLVAWRTPQAVYWVSNTLTDDIPNGELAAIAASLTQG
ncbi:MAG: LCP family protein [Solirubrobacteraceae bacterium]